MTSIVLSPDNHLYDPRTGEYHFSTTRVRRAWESTYKALDRALQSGRFHTVTLLVGIPASGKSTFLKANRKDGHIYMDATFVKKEWRAGPIKAAKDAGAKVEALVMTTPKSVCLARNRERSPDRKVPETKVCEMFDDLMKELPSEAEGLDRVQFVPYRDLGEAVVAFRALTN